VQADGSLVDAHTKEAPLERLTPELLAALAAEWEQEGPPPAAAPAAAMGAWW
jgi:hypothetical protein